MHFIYIVRVISEYFCRKWCDRKNRYWLKENMCLKQNRCDGDMCLHNDGVELDLLKCCDVSCECIHVWLPSYGCCFEYVHAHINAYYVTCLGIKCFNTKTGFIAAKQRKRMQNDRFADYFCSSYFYYKMTNIMRLLPQWTCLNHVSIATKNEIQLDFPVWCDYALDALQTISSQY